MTGEWPFRRRMWIIWGACMVLVLGAVCSWALLTVLRPTAEPRESTRSTYVTVVPGVVGETRSLNALADWPQATEAANQASGIVTSVAVEPGAEVGQGATLYTVGLRPVTIAQGDVPMFRQIREGVVGTDVRQLQDMLASLGYYRAGIDGEVGPRTIAAIREWQANLGLEKTGVVELADLVFVPHLPNRVALSAQFIHRGAVLSGGEEAVFGLPPAPEFQVPSTEAQAATMPAGTSVEITSPSGRVWRGVAGEQRRGDDGSVSTVVTGEGGSPLCGGECGEIPASGQTTLLSRIVVVPQVEGLVVPSSALVTTADGGTAAIVEDGKRVPVEVRASAKGISVVSGLAEGQRVRVPAGSAP